MTHPNAKSTVETAAPSESDAPQVAAPKAPPPAELSPLDLANLRWRTTDIERCKLAVEKANRDGQDAVNALSGLQRELMSRYKMSPEDRIEPNGAITRKTPAPQAEPAVPAAPSPAAP